MLDRNCPNQSFKEMRILLQEFGVKNNQFMLETNNKKVSDIDLLTDKTLSDKVDLTALRSEIESNIWYYLRRILCIPTVYGSQLHHFELTPLGMEIIWAYEQGFNVIIDCPQNCHAGLTTILAAILTHRFVSGAEQWTTNVTRSFVSRSTDSREVQSLESGLESTAIHKRAETLLSTVPYAIRTGVNVDVARSTDIDLDIRDLERLEIHSLRDISNRIKAGTDSQHIAVIRRSPYAGNLDNEDYFTFKWVLQNAFTPFTKALFDLDEGALRIARTRMNPLLINVGDDELCKIRAGIH